jgi:hypothetical protein
MTTAIAPTEIISPPKTAQLATSAAGETLLLNAHNEWRTRPADQRFENLDALAQSLQARRDRSRTIDIAPEDIKVEPTAGDNIVFGNDLVTARPNHWSFSQISQLAGAPAGYLATLPAPILTEALRHGLARRENEDGSARAVRLLVADRGDGKSSDLLAATSTTYGRIWDIDVVNATRSLIDRLGGRFRNPLNLYPDGTTRPGGLYASDRDIFMFFVDGGDGGHGGAPLDDGKSEIHKGFFVWNSEVRSKSFGVMTFLFRVTCLNAIVWGADQIQELRIRHTVNAPERFITEALPALEKYAASSLGDEARRIRAAQAFGKIPAIREEAIVWLTERGFTKPEAAGGLRHAEAEEGGWGNLWRLVNGITAYARTYAHIDAKVDLERKAGRLLANLTN